MRTLIIGAGVVGFNIASRLTAEGHDVTVIEAVPPGLKDDSTARAINRSRFRPRIVDGAFVRVPGQARNFTFHYLPRD